MLRVVKIAVLSLATEVQALLVAYLETKDPPAAAWFRDNWSGARGRYCVCHAGYSGSNNNMGVEVDWRDIKKICPSRSKLGTFIGALIHFVRELGQEHANFLAEQGTPGSFIRHPVITKDVWDRVQGVHPKTLACSFLVSGKGKSVVSEWDRINAAILRTCSDDTALHLKIRAWIEDCQTTGTGPKITLGAIQILIMPRQSTLRRLDPSGSKTIERVRYELNDDAYYYMQQIIDNKIPADATVHSVLDIYETWHMISRQLTWSPVPLSCTCLDSSKNCICVHTTLCASIFDSTLVVPDAYITSQPSLRKKTRMMKGTAGPKRLRLQQAIADEKRSALAKAAVLSPRRRAMEAVEDSDHEEVRCVDSLITPCLHFSISSLISQDIPTETSSQRRTPSTSQSSSKSSTGKARFLATDRSRPPLRPRHIVVRFTRYLAVMYRTCSHLHVHPQEDNDDPPSPGATAREPANKARVAPVPHIPCSIHLPPPSP